VPRKAGRKAGNASQFADNRYAANIKALPLKASDNRVAESIQWNPKSNQLEIIYRTPEATSEKTA